jgi:hypothetical protein
MTTPEKFHSSQRLDNMLHLCKSNYKSYTKQKISVEPKCGLTNLRALSLSLSLSLSLYYLSEATLISSSCDLVAMKSGPITPAIDVLQQTTVPELFRLRTAMAALTLLYL